MIPAARAVNDGMPLHIADLLEQALTSTEREMKGARVLVMGYAYLEDSDDTRNSPSETLLRRLGELGAQAVIHDPYVREYQGDLLQMARGCDAALVMVKHRAYTQIDLAALKAVMRTPILIDGRRVFDAVQMQSLGYIFFQVGQAR